MVDARNVASQRLERALIRSQLERKKRVAHHLAMEEEQKRARRDERVREARRLAKSEGAVISVPEPDCADLTEAEQCPVCLTDIVQPGDNATDEKLQVLACGHTFHAACIGPWLKRKQSCPLCRAPCNVPSPEPTPSAPARARRPHRCGNPTVLQFANGPYCAGCLRWLAAHEDPP